MEPLFSRDKSGKNRYWTITVDNSPQGVFITRRYGQVGGKETVTSTEITTGKNIGRSNETTKLEQANLEAMSTWKKQVEAGFTVDQESNQVVTILPMLANKWEDRSHNISEPFYVQPKLDGVRMIIGRYQGTLKTLSRTGKVFKMPHIEKVVGSLLEEGQFLDGELFSDELTFQEITGVCGSKKNTSQYIDKIKFHVFDYFDLANLGETFKNRSIELHTRFSDVCVLVATFVLFKKGEVQFWHDKFVSQGHEGIMIRDAKGPYLLNQRSNHLLKLKAFQTEEYMIIGASEGKGSDAGTVIWECVGPKGSFSVRPKGTRDERIKWFQNYEKYLGKKLTVQFQNLTDGGIPRFPVGLSIRDYE